MRGITGLLMLGVVLSLTTPSLACGSCGCSDSCGGDDVMTSAPGKKDIVDTAVSAGSFSTLVAAVKAAGLVETLKGEGPFTVFAPTDAAFKALPAGTIEALLKDTPKLRQILTYHVVPGNLAAANVVKSTWLETAQGQAARIRVGEDGAFIDNARIIKTDIETSNGTIHVLDAVILPREDIVDTAAGAKDFSTLVAAVKTAGLAETLRGKGPFTVFAPVNSAFAKLPEGALEGLLKDKAALRKVLTLHVVPGRVLSTDLPTGSIAAKTAAGATIRVSRNERGQVDVNGSNVIKADLVVGNGVIHVIDTVILPE
jgi:uncharacterized surface protein with fasciclin (FAS1) repeats